MNKSKFYVLSYTWGLPMSLIGSIVALLLIITGHKPKKYGYCWHFEVGNNWGGVSFGPIFLSQKNANELTKYHEHGHSLQNCYYGFIMPFVICIPSFARYWYREYLHRVRHVPYSSMPDYDSIWFEADATKRGKEFMNKYRSDVNGSKDC